VLVLEFGSFRSMLIVAGVIPLGMAGGIIALFVTGYDLSFTATIGLVALIGIEIKNSILLVDFTNQLREQGVALDDAITQAGEIRFLPILLTSATAIGGLLPLALRDHRRPDFVDAARTAGDAGHVQDVAADDRGAAGREDRRVAAARPVRLRRLFLQESGGIEAQALDRRQHARPLRDEKLLALVAHEVNACARRDEHAAAAPFLDQAFIDQLLVALQHRQGVERVLGRHAAHRGQRITLGEGAFEDHRHHLVAELTIDRLVVVPGGVHALG
jgi:AcrB/AcrD/AcrF family